MVDDPQDADFKDYEREIRNVWLYRLGLVERQVDQISKALDTIGRAIQRLQDLEEARGDRRDWSVQFWMLIFTASNIAIHFIPVGTGH